jgi:hypothetical protein
VDLEASWTDGEGNTYAVRCCEKLASAGTEYPTFGGVLTNHLHHGFTRIGTPLMPTLFSDFAFWGIGTVLKNGEVTDSTRLVHGMLTEYVRHGNYELAFDDEVQPSARHFHVMVPAYMPGPDGKQFEKNPVSTGFMLQNGSEMPFWHVMFENLDISASPTQVTANERESGVEELPSRVRLRNNYPNPFNPSTTPTYELPEATPVRLTVYDVLGRHVRTLVDKQIQPAGRHQVTFEARGLPSGMYLYRLETEARSISKVMMLAK